MRQDVGKTETGFRRIQKLATQAAKELEKARRGHNDKQVREKADEALKNNGNAHRFEPATAKDGGAKQDQNAKNAQAKGKEESTGKDPANANAKANSAKKDANGQAKEGQPTKDNGKTNQAKGNGQDGGKANQTTDTPAEIKANAVDLNAAKRSSNLVLDDWRKKLEKVKDTLKWSHEDMERFLEQVRLLDGQQRGNKSRPKTPDANQLTGKFQGPGIGPRMIGGSPQQISADRVGVGQPPEFREALRRKHTGQRGESAPPK